MDADRRPMMVDRPRSRPVLAGMAGIQAAIRKHPRPVFGKRFQWFIAKRRGWRGSFARTGLRAGFGGIETAKTKFALMARERSPPPPPFRRECA
jgi:hypothetical protein